MQDYACQITNGRICVGICDYNLMVELLRVQICTSKIALEEDEAVQGKVDRLTEHENNTNRERSKKGHNNRGGRDDNNVDMTTLVNRG
jgi:hypothetical protein